MYTNINNIFRISQLEEMREAVCAEFPYDTAMRVLGAAGLVCNISSLYSSMCQFNRVLVPALKRK